MMLRIWRGTRISSVVSGFGSMVDVGVLGCLDGLSDTQIVASSFGIVFVTYS